jgi:hypothetical protein
MEIKTRQVTDIQGNPLVNQAGKTLCFGDVILEVILAETAEDQKSQDLGTNKLYRYNLAKRFLEESLDEDELAFVKSRAALLCSSLIYGKLLEVLQTE